MGASHDGTVTTVTMADGNLAERPLSLVAFLLSRRRSSKTWQLTRDRFHLRLVSSSFLPHPDYRKLFNLYEKLTERARVRIRRQEFPAALPWHASFWE
jgi:hypothetical protein